MARGWKSLNGTLASIAALVGLNASEAAERRSATVRMPLKAGEQLVSVFEDTYRGIQIVTFDPQTRECTMRYYKVTEGRHRELALRERTTGATVVLTNCTPTSTAK